MKNKITAASILVIVLSLSLFSFAYGQDLWTIPATSKAKFTIDGMLGVDCNGTLDFMSSYLKFDPNNPGSGSFEVVLSVASINTNIQKRDKHLKTDDFFGAARYPTISFKSSSIKRSGNGYVVTGSLKIKDVVKLVSIPFTFVPKGKTAVFKGGFKINRMDYKVGEKQKRGIGNLVNITLDIPVNAK